MSNIKFKKLQYKEGFKVKDNSIYKIPKGLNREVIAAISRLKQEPKWMLDIRLSAYDVFLKKSMPSWGADLSKLDFDNINYYSSSQENESDSWEKIPKDVKESFDKLNIPESEHKYLAGVKAQFDSEVVYGSLLKTLKKLGVIFLSTDEALKQYPEIVKKHFGTVVSSNDNKFAALNTAVWSGGSFIYVPKNVKVEKPLQAYFRINAKRMGQFERTLIVLEDGAFATYIEGCSAPIYSESSLHAAVVEVIVKKDARFRYTTIQNWYTNVYNLVTKRAFVYKNGIMEWVDGNIGSKVTMKYPSIYLLGENAKGDVTSLAFASKNQHLDNGTKVFLLASNASTNIISKSVSNYNGRSSFRSLVKVSKQAKNAKVNVVCDALLLDKNSQTDTYPKIINENISSKISHEASVSKISKEVLFYLKTRGINETEASSLVVNGFIEPIIKTLPMEYAIELNRLIEISMDHSVG